MERHGIKWFEDAVCAKCDNYTKDVEESCSFEVMKACIESEKLKIMQNVHDGDCINVDTGDE